jgi:aspartate kinase
VKVFKFGGFAVSTSANIKNLVEIINMNSDDQLLIIVSAMGKTTDALEKLCAAYINNKEEAFLILKEIKQFHDQIILELFELQDHPVFDEIANTFIEIEWILEDEPHPDYNFNYDQIVSIGELVSSKIISAYLTKCNIKNKWIDARSYIHTDNTYREGIINWDKTKASIYQLKEEYKAQTIISQGFIGGTSENFTTTLGREGSDYSAAVFAACLLAESLTVWKDVPGIMNADPALFSSAQKYDELPYSEALELAYYGANIIHPKTIKPLQNEGIALLVKPFLNPEQKGTRIDQFAKPNTQIQAIVLKKNQVLLNISTKDFSYMDERNLSDLLHAFSEAHIKLNMMQLSALSLSVCIDQNSLKLKKLTNLFESKFLFSIKDGLELLTIIHFREEELKKLCKDRIIIMEQFSGKIAQFVMK